MLRISLRITTKYEILRIRIFRQACLCARGTVASPPVSPMSADLQLKIRRNAAEMQEAIEDLHKWEEKIKAKDQALKETPVVAKVRAPPPPLRPHTHTHTHTHTHVHTRIA